jgi:type IV pilus assembly protein PilC
MLRSGLTVLRSLEISAEQATTRALDLSTLRVIDRIRSGQTLSSAMAEERHYGEFAVQMVASAEASGELDRVIDELADHVEHSSKVLTSLLTSLAYPAIVFIGAVAVATFLVLGVLPTIARVLTRRGQALRWPAQTLVDLSAFVEAWGLYILLGGALALLIGIVWLSTSTGRLFSSAAILRVPMIGSLLRCALVSRLSRTLAMLVESGVPLMSGLRICAGVVRNPSVRVKLEEASDSVLGGSTLAESIDRAPFPPLLASVVSVGEQTGALPRVLGEVSQHYDDTLKRRIERLSLVAEPAILLIVGGMVGFVYYALIDAILFAQSGGR